MLNWANRFSIFCFLDNNGYNPQEASFDCCLAAGAKQVFRNNISQVNLMDKNKTWLFGHLSFECFDEIPVQSSEPFVDFEKSFFFEPEYLFLITGNNLKIITCHRDAQSVFDEVISQTTEYGKTKKTVQFQHAISKEEYLNRLKGIFAHIQRGDCYEINFCQHFFAEKITIDPVKVFTRLNSISANPFAALYRINNKYGICASPERFLQKKGDSILSQPIKGTIKRSKDPVEDEELKQTLEHSFKNRTENVMIVDLVRNDLSMVCEEGSVSVPSMYEVKSYPKVHHMVSSVMGKINERVTFSEMMHACFPMGSMTGAPKKRVIELIKEFEKEPRGLFSGTIGYINGQGDFDFNVVIRSLMYDAEKQIISFKTGGGITAASNAEDEYEESLLKAAAGMEVLAGD